jgi:CAAX prenyl protease-like protein
LLILVVVLMVSPVFAGAVDWLYPVRVIAVAAILWLWRREYTDLRWTWSWQAVAVGAGVFLMWIGLERRVPGADAGEALQAGVAGLSPVWEVVWIGFRILGSVVTVPLAEELAFRGYLLRQLTARDFRSVPPGRFTVLACLASSVLFGAMHGRWLAGTLAGLVYALALRRRGELADAVLAHAVTNGLLAAYILTTGEWVFWAS